MSAERREQRGFEPPPWEKEQFDELSRRKQSEQPAADEVASDAAEVADRVVPEPAMEQPVDLNAIVPEIGATGEKKTQDGGEIDPARMTELMAGLKAEEPSADRFWKLGLAVALFLVVLGSVMLIWGIVALQATRGSGQPLGWIGAAGLMTFGVGFISVAAWLAYHNLKRQGVL